jgi:PKD repeat protein
LGDLNSLSFTYSHPDGVLPVTISFVATASNASTVSWDFGDGQTGTGIAVSHTYSQEGLYNVIISTISADGVHMKRTSVVQVLPYTQIQIFKVNVTIPHPAWIHYKVRNSAGIGLLDVQYPSYSTSGDSLASTPSPPLLINDLQHSLTVEIWNYTNIISTISINPYSFIQNTLPFPAVFTGSDSQGRTVTLYVSWN